MIWLETEIEGKRGQFGLLKDVLERYGYALGGNWDYDKGYFDHVLWRKGGETIYKRLPFHVFEGELDRRDAYIQFDRPYVIKHVVHVGLDRDDNALLTVTGLNQFQKPLDKDGHIRDKTRWEFAAEQLTEDVIKEIKHKYSAWD